MDVHSKVAAVVVTYNRKQLLTYCLDALCSQVTLPNTVLIIDNASTDGTHDLFTHDHPWERLNLEYVQLSKNIGGAGGFHEGLKLATQTDCDWCWIMDDDTIPAPDALVQLLNATAYLARKQIVPSFVASHVQGEEGEVMNVPNVSFHLAQNGYPDWLEHLPAGLVRVSSATFVSLLVNMQAIKHVGLPISDYFLWGDDIEYTLRLTSFHGPAFVCGSSYVTHLRKDARPISISNEQSINRIANHRRRIRNDLINAGYYGGGLKSIRRIAHHALKCAQVLASPDAHKVAKAKAIGGGIVDYLAHHYDLEDLGKLDRRTMNQG